MNHWQLITFLLCSLAGIFRFLTLCNHLVKTLQRRVNAELGMMIQDHVFVIAERAVMITERSFKNSTYPKEKKCHLKLNNAKTIIVDVLLQNGLDPKLYNIEGLIDYAMFKLSL
jgi:hypothetical protein